MAKLTNSHEVRVDERGRAALPAKHLENFRTIALEGRDSEASAEEELEIVVGFGLGTNLCVYPKNVHDNLLAYLDSQPLYDPYWNRIRSIVVGTADPQKLDRQNRFKIPTLLANKLGLTGEVVVKGVNDHLELIAKGAWESDFDDYMKNFTEIHGKAMAASAGQRA